ncbi:MAG TPA: protease pro-enzyme activation domain-containing protein, partial [Acidimicrobiia bacterium]|nr:protease pro-enzyme activation domain-containing protein [Acidimicrobiia bacterium]
MVAVASVVSLAAVAVPVGLGTAPPAGAVAAPRTVPAAALPGGAIDTGSVDPSTSLHLSVALDPRDVAALDAFVADVSTPGSPSYGRYLSPGEFGARFGADPATVKDVTAQLRAEGLQPGAPDPNMLSIPVEATAGQATAAFGTRFAHTRLADGGVVTRHTAPAVVPRGAAGILGLDSWPRSHKALPAALAESSAVAATTCTAASSMAGVWSPAQLAAAYGMSSLGATTTGGAG